MPASTMITVGQRYKILTGMEMFDEKTKPEDYFNNEENVKNARIAYFQKEGRDHYAKITTVDRGKGKVYYTDSSTRQSSIDINELDGIMYYDKNK